MSRLKTFHEIFSQNDVEIAENVINTYNCGRSVIGINAPSETNWVAGWIADVVGIPSIITLRTPRLEYAIRVLALATAITTHSDDDLFDLWMGWRWEKTDGGFKELKFVHFRSDKSLEELCERFWKILEEVANSGNLYVTKGYYPSAQKDVYLGLGLDWVVICDQDMINKSNAISFSVDALNQQWDNSKISYSWDEIKDLFIQLTPNQMRIIKHKWLHNHTELDDKLLDACGCWDLDKIKKYVEEGANINCLDEDGLSVLTRAIYNLPYYELYTRGGMTADEVDALKAQDYEKCISTIDLLLEYGADIDFYGYRGVPPVIAAYRKGHIPIALHLLDCGANYHLPMSLIANVVHSLDEEIKYIYKELSSDKYVDNKNAKVLRKMIHGIYSIDL
jgi:hypothetical protein